MDLMSLLAKLTLDKDNFDKGLEDAQEEANKLNIPAVTVPKPNTDDFKAGVTEAAEESGGIISGVMTGVWQELKDSFVQIIGVSAVTGTVRYIKEGIKLAFQNGKAISDGAKSLGISTKAYQEYEYALGKSNLKMKDLTTVMKRMDELMGGKKLTEDQAEWLGKLGINAEEAANKEQLLADVMGSLANYQDTDKGMIIDWLFGNKQEWEGFFNQTEDDINSLKKTADNFLMSDQAIEDAQKLDDTYQKLQDTLNSIQRTVGEKFLPLIEQLISGVAEVVKWLSGKGNEGDLNAQLQNTESELAKTQATIDGTAKSAEDMVKKYYEMSDAEKQAAESQEELKKNAQWLIENFPELADVIDQETGAITGEKDAVLDRIKAWKDSNTEQAKANAETEKQNILTEAGTKIAEKQDEVRAKQIEANNKLNEQAALMTNMVQSNPALSRIFETQYGTTQVTAGSEDFEGQLKFLQSNAYRYGLDSGTLNTMEQDYTDLINEMKSLESEAANLEEQLAQAEAATGASAQAAIADVNSLESALDKVEGDRYVTIHVNTSEEGFPNAIGNAYVPYDNYPALLHRGERVLTATENRRGESGGGSIDYTQLENRIVASIKAGMEGATVNSYINGKKVTDEVNRQNINAVKGRRFSR